MDIHDRDELWTEHDGQSRVLDYNKVADEITRLQRELAAARAEVACLTAYRDGLAKNVAELEKANEKLRAALEAAGEAMLNWHLLDDGARDEATNAARGARART